VFAIASLVTPLAFGMTVGALASGNLPAAEAPLRVRDLWLPWTRPFPVAVGLLTLALFAFLAATYLTRETADRELVEDFRKRALIAGGLAMALALLALGLAGSGAPRLFDGCSTG
jgi:cytochrome d ubiquinol oxidase subunit II